jgi:hypothetical protein
MTLDYQLQPSDLVAFSQEQRRFIPQLPSQVYYYVVLPALFVTLGVVMDSLAVAAVFAVLYLSSGWFVRYWIERQYLRAAFSSESLAIQTLPRRVTLSEDGVSFSSDAGVLLYRWPFIREVVRGSRYVYFVLTPIERLHIPIRAFRDDHHIEQFISTARSYVKTRAA